VIGGLIQNTEEMRKTKIPGLGDIPILGELIQEHIRTRRSRPS
jgi:type II secretory pathway component GspD/PulD (secretin)